MLIKSLKIENFRQFKGEIKLDFSCDSFKNVTVILGDNTFGKTTLLQAFRWCLYGKALFNNEPNFLLNKEIAHDMRDGDARKVGVEVVIRNAEIDYTITRTQKYFRQGIIKDYDLILNIAYKKPDGQTKNFKDSEKSSIINKIMPEGLSQYFFFDTERVNSVSNKKDVAKAVKEILGLEIIDNAIQHLGTQNRVTSVIGKFYGALDTESPKKAQDTKNKMQRAEESRSVIAEKLNNCNEQINQYEQRREVLQKILRDNESTTDLQKQKEFIESQLKKENLKIADMTNKYFKDFSIGAISFFSSPLVEKAAQILQKIKVEDAQISNVTQDLIKDLLKRGRCICGRRICKNNIAYNNLLAELENAAVKPISGELNAYRDKLKDFSAQTEAIFDRLSDRYNDIVDSKEQIFTMTDELNKISDKIKNKSDMKATEYELAEVNRRIADFNQKKEQLLRDDGIKQNEIETLKKNYDRLIISNEKNQLIIENINYAQKISNWLVENYKIEEIKIREALEAEVNKIFAKMYHGKRRVTIDEKYQVTLMTSVADEEIISGESEGLNRVKSFAFIAGLVSVAKRKINTDNKKNGFSLANEPFPLVLDAPFSNADEKHTANISKILPEVSEQVIMFVMKKDWNYAEKVMSERVGKKYQLQKITETYTTLK